VKAWVYSGISSNFMSTSEWPIVFRFSGLADLNEKLKAEGAESIDRLVIASHGDKAGYIGLDPPLQDDASPPARHHLAYLRNFLASNARVMFIACMAGRGRPGDKLLMAISSVLATCEIVGFIVPNETWGPIPGGFKVYMPDNGRNDEWSTYAKWARNGSIIRPSFFERTRFQETDPTKRNRCGSHNCPGHSARGLNDVCDPYRRVKWPEWDSDSPSAAKRPAPPRSAPLRPAPLRPGQRPRK
jgi:hypothetical protein